MLASQDTDTCNIANTLSRRKRVIAQRFARAQNYDKHAAIQTLTCQHLLESIINKQQQHVLEIGAGTGQMTRLLAQQISSEDWTINELTQQHSDSLQTILPQANIVIGDAESLVFDDIYSLIISANAVQWFDNPLSIVTQSVKRLQPNGQLLFNTFTENNFLQIKQLTDQGLNYPNTDIWQQHLEYSGFEHIHLATQRYNLHFDSPYKVLKHIKNTGVSTHQALTVSDSTPYDTAFKWTKSSLRAFEKAYWTHFATKNRHGKSCVVLTYDVLIISAIKKDHTQI